MTIISFAQELRILCLFITFLTTSLGQTDRHACYTIRLFQIERRCITLRNAHVVFRFETYISIWCVCIYIYIYVCVCVCVCVCIYIYIYVCICLYIYIYIYIYIYVCVCVYIYILYIYIYVCVCVYVKRNTPLGFCKRNVLNWISVLLCQLVTLYTIHDSWPCNRPSLTIFYLFIYAGMYGLHHWGGVGKILQHLVVR